MKKRKTEKKQNMHAIILNCNNSIKKCILNVYLKRKMSKNFDLEFCEIVLKIKYIE